MDPNWHRITVPVCTILSKLLSVHVWVSWVRYSHFTISSPDCTFHAAITHMIKVLEWWSLTWIPMAKSCVRLCCSNTVITWVFAVCKVQSRLEIVKWLYCSALEEQLAMLSIVYENTAVTTHHSKLYLVSDIIVGWMASCSPVPFLAIATMVCTRARTEVTKFPLIPP